MSKCKITIFLIVFVLIFLMQESYASNEERSLKINNELQGMTLDYIQATNAGGSQAFANMSLQHIEDMQKEVKELKAKGEDTVEKQKFLDKMQPLRSPTEEFYPDFIKVVEEEAEEAKEVIAASLAASYLMKTSSFSPQKAFSDLFEYSSTTIPNNVVVPAWFQSVEEHFAKAKAQHSAEEFRRGVNLAKAIPKQIANWPNGMHWQLDDLPDKDSIWKEIFCNPVEPECRNFHGKLATEFFIGGCLDDITSAGCAVDILTSIPGLNVGKGGKVGKIRRSLDKDFPKPKNASIGHHKYEGQERHYQKHAGTHRNDYFDIPDDVWKKMTGEERWAANRKFLDEKIKQRATFDLANPIKREQRHKVRRDESAFEKEIWYIIEHGYKLSKDGKRLIPE